MRAARRRSSPASRCHPNSRLRPPADPAHPGAPEDRAAAETMRTAPRFVAGSPPPRRPAGQRPAPAPRSCPTRRQARP
ncbi:hypothetical protein G6F35_017301 [Rhizopus arrhizus]|nr:hypothetical protein G6F35_017301 [Rhizopus arrhizus]